MEERVFFYYFKCLCFIGVWSPYLGEMAGVNVPLCAMKHAYVVTERIEGIQNMPNVRDHDASVYLKLQGDALCVGGYELNPVFWDKVMHINIYLWRQVTIVTMFMMLVVHDSLITISRKETLFKAITQ